MSPGQLMVKIVHEELTELMGGQKHGVVLHALEVFAVGGQTGSDQGTQGDEPGLAQLVRELVFDDR